MRRAYPPRARRTVPSLLSSHRRLVGLLVVFCLLFALVVGRLVQLQVVEPGRYVTQGVRQRVVSTQVPAGRGSLVDRNGVELALSVPKRSVFADPALVTDPERYARILAPILDLEQPKLESQLRRPGRYVVLVHTVADGVAERIEELDLPGIAMFDEYERFVPGGAVARSLIGRVSEDGAVGYSGLERQYDDVLAGESGSITYERSKEGGHTIAAGRRKVKAAQPGSAVVLTLDRALQFQAERVLADAVHRTGAEGAMAIVTRPATGEVLAMANVVLDRERGTVVPAVENSALTTVFEPGSVSKVVTVGGVLEEGVVEPESKLTVPYRIEVADKVFDDDNHTHETEDMTVTRILAHSSNVGTIKLAQQFGRQRLERYLRRFGFGRRTGLGFPDESPGLLQKEWAGPAIASVAIGHGISVTAMQLLTAVNVVANDGVLVAPRLVEATVDPDGRRHTADPSARRRVVSPETAKDLTDMLTQVTDEGTGTEAGVDGYPVAGKTGTARKVQPNGGYLNENGVHEYMSSFAGFLPASDPELSIIVVIDSPKGKSVYGGDVAAPAFSQLARWAVRQYQIPPTEAPRPGQGPTETVEERVPAPDTSAPRPTTTTTAPPGQPTTTTSTTSTTAPPGE